MNASAECLLCAITRELRAVDGKLDKAEKAAYFRRMLTLVIESAPEESTAEVHERVSALHAERFGEGLPFAPIKKRYNALLLSLEDALRREIKAASDPLLRAMALSQAGNYIDYGTIEQVTEDTLKRLLSAAANVTIDEKEYAHFRSDLGSAKTLCYVTDNAGEVVLDKLLIRLLLEAYPSLSITALVRGGDALNDATEADAHEVGLDALVPVLGNGTCYPGTVLSKVSKEARALLESADLIVAKGQGNFETLCGCGLNAYYSFLCKCDYFVKKFGQKPLTPMFVNERRLPTGL